MAEKVTVMVLKVDLQCPCCYKKVKKILCKFPQIRDQVYDEKANTVTITVISCNPEKIRDKLCCKGCKVIKSIEIKEPPKPKPPPPKPAPPKPDPPKPSPPKPTPPKPPEVAPPQPPPVTGPKILPGCPPVRICCRPCCEGCGWGPCSHGCGVPLPPQPCCGWCWACGCCQRGWCCCVSRCDYYFSEDNPRGCSIM